MDCDALKFCGFSNTTKEILKLDIAEFNILKRQAADFMRDYNIDRAVESTIKDPEDEGLYQKFMQGMRRNAFKTNNKLD